MTAGRRVATIEAALSPRAAILAWLAEAQTYAGLDAYARSLLDVPIEAAPLTRLEAQVAESAKASSRGRPSRVVSAAVEEAVGDVVFLYTLVIGINLAAREMAELEGLRAAALRYWRAAQLAESRPRDVRAPADERAWGIWQQGVDGLAATVAIEEQARVTLAERYLDGRPLLLPDAERDWAALRVAVGWLDPAIDEGSRQDPSANAVMVRARHLADNARARTFELLGEHERAVAIMERRLRAGAAVEPD